MWNRIGKNDHAEQLRPTGLDHVTSIPKNSSQDLRTPQATIVNSSATHADTRDAWRRQRPMAVGNNLFTLHMNRGDQPRPTGLDCVAFQKTHIGTLDPLSPALSIPMPPMQAPAAYGRGGASAHGSEEQLVHTLH